MYVNDRLLQTQMTSLKQIDEKLERRPGDMDNMAIAGPVNANEHMYYDQMDGAKYDQYVHQQGIEYETAPYNQYAEHMESTDEDCKDDAMGAMNEGECSRPQRGTKTVSVCAFN